MPKSSEENLHSPVPGNDWWECCPIRRLRRVMNNGCPGYSRMKDDIRRWLLSFSSYCLFFQKLVPFRGSVKKFFVQRFRMEIDIFPLRKGVTSMAESSKKICEISDPGELRSEILRDKGGEYSCTTCCAVSHDKADLCKPANTEDAKIFCEIEV